MHFKNIHGITGRHGNFVCGQPQCGRSFHDRYVLSRHIHTEHSTDVEMELVQVDHDDPVCILDEGFEADYAVSDISSADKDSSPGDGIRKDLQDLEQLAAEFTCR